MSANPHFRVAGIPVRIEPLFWLVAVFIAYNLGDARLIIMWVGVVLVSVLVHELGHAIALKGFGQPSSIVLHGFGGVTRSRGRLSKARSIIVTLAGPLSALLLLGLPAYLLREREFGLDAYRSAGNVFGLWPIIVFAAYVNIWWSIANLLPIRPLDGGNVMTELIGVQKARLLSVVVGAAAAVWAYTHADQLQYAAFFAGFLAFINFSEHRKAKQGAAGPSSFDVEAPDPGGAPGGGRRPSRPGSSGPSAGRSQPAPRRRGGWPSGPPTAAPASTSEPPTPITGSIDPASAESFAWNMLRRGDASGARRVLQRSSGPVGPFVHATVAVADGQGVDPLVEAYRANPGGPSNLVPASVAADTGQVLEIVRRLLGHGPTGVEAASSIQTHLHYAERFEHAAAVGELVYGAGGGGARAQTAFDVACSWARAGDTDRCLEWLDRAITDGFAAPTLLDGEPDLAPVRADPRWATVRRRLG